MYKLIIADDERIIRDGLTKLFDWNSLGFEIIKSFNDGAEVIEYIKNNDVDVILTDIKMISMSGIDVAKYIFDNNLNIKVILISGYKEFELARQALRYNVKNYILKPTSMHELVEVFQVVKKELDTEEYKSNTEKMEKQQSEALTSLLMQNLFRDIIMGFLENGEEIQKRMDLLGVNIDINKSIGCILEVEINDRNNSFNNKWKEEKVKYSIFNMIDVNKEEVVYISINNKSVNNFYIIAVASVNIDADNFNRILEEHIKSIQYSLSISLGLRMSTVCTYFFKKISEINGFYNSKFKTSECLLTENDNIDDIAVYKILYELENKFISYINADNFNMVLSMFNECTEQLRLMTLSIVKNFIIELFVIIFNRLKCVDIDILGDKYYKLNYIDMLKINNFEQLKAWCRDKLELILESTAKWQTGSSDKGIVAAAKKYIKENYNKDISLEDVAQNVYVSSVYFSRVFKNVTGENFIDFMVKLRMEKAMELLRNPKYKAYEVSEMVGYSSIKYFAKLFKQYTGFTTSEYRQNVLKGSVGQYEE